MLPESLESCAARVLRGVSWSLGPISGKVFGKPKGRVPERERLHRSRLVWGHWYSWTSLESLKRNAKLGHPVSGLGTLGFGFWNCKRAEKGEAKRNIIYIYMYDICEVRNRLIDLSPLIGFSIYWAMWSEASVTESRPTQPCHYKPQGCNAATTLFPTQTGQLRPFSRLTFDLLQLRSPSRLVWLRPRFDPHPAFHRDGLHEAEREAILVHRCIGPSVHGAESVSVHRSVFGSISLKPLGRSDAHQER